MNQVFEVPELWIPVAATLIPALTALLTKQGASNRVRAFIAGALSVALPFLEHVTTGTISTSELVPAIVLSMMAQVSAYSAVWKHINVNDRVAPKRGVTKIAFVG